MKYEMILYAGSRTLTAFDVTGNRYISIEGNRSCLSGEVNYFFECLLDYYNVDDLQELDSCVRIISGNSSEKNIRFFAEKFGKLAEFSIWRAEELLPIVLLEDNRINRAETVYVKIYDQTYNVTTDAAFNFTVTGTDQKAGIELALEELTLMNHFNGVHFHGDEEEAKRLHSLVKELEKSRDDLLRKLADKTQECTNLKKELDAGKIRFRWMIGNDGIKKKVKKYLCESIPLVNFQIKTEYDPESVAMRVEIQNNASMQNYIFGVPAAISGSYTKERFEEDLYKKIAKAIQMMNENQAYNKLKNSNFSILKRSDTFQLDNYKVKLKSIGEMVK